VLHISSKEYKANPSQIIKKHCIITRIKNKVNQLDEFSVTVVSMVVNIDFINIENMKLIPFLLCFA